jgi:viroplasmin and RNaseH domain-containing protein
MTKTNEEVLEFLGGARQWLAKNPDESKLRYAVTRNVKNAEKVQKKVQKKIDRLNVEFALEKDGKLLRTERGDFEYSREDMLKRADAIEKVMQEEVDFEPYHPTEITREIKDEEKDLLLGFVIKEGTNGDAPLATG